MVVIYIQVRQSVWSEWDVTSSKVGSAIRLQLRLKAGPDVRKRQSGLIRMSGGRRVSVVGHKLKGFNCTMLTAEQQ